MSSPPATRRSYLRARCAVTQPVRPAKVTAEARRSVGDEEEAGRGGAGGEGRGDVAARVAEGLEGEAVGDGEEVGDDGLGVEAEAEDALVFLGAEDVGDVGAGRLEELADLVLDVRVAAAGAEELVEEEEEAGVVVDQVGEALDEDVEDGVRGLRLGEHLVEAGDAEFGVAPDDLDQEALLGAEVIVEEAAADPGLAGDVLEGRARRPAASDAVAHRVDDALRLLAAELALFARRLFGRRLH